jgi:cytochrome c-type biogenesis protein CcmF
LFLDAMGLGKISVGPPYFDTVFGLLMAPLLFAMGVGPLTRWREDAPATIARRLRWALPAAIGAAILIGWFAGRVGLITTGGLALACWIVASLVVDLRERLRPTAHPTSLVTRLRLIPRAMVGMMVAHLGVAVFAFGVAMVKTYEQERDVKMGPDSSTELAGYRFRMIDVHDVQGPNYVAAQGQIEVSRNDAVIATLRPEKRVYRVQTNPMTEAAVHSNPLRDLYVSMGEQLPTGEWVVRVQYKPFINWIWLGCLSMMLGGFLAMTDRRYRQRQTRTDALPAHAAGAGVSQ